MSTYSILPAELNLVVLKGDEFTMDVTFSTSLVGYTWESEIFESTKTVNSNYPGGLSTEGDNAGTFTVTVSDAVAGELNLSLDETITAALSEATAYRWYLRGVAPGAVTRTYVSGTFTVRAP
jgi:hypothetical protein